MTHPTNIGGVCHAAAFTDQGFHPVCMEQANIGQLALPVAVGVTDLYQPASVTTR